MTNLKIGDVFGRLTLYETSMKVLGSRRIRVWDCSCDCGEAKTIRDQDLKAGKTLSCGCLRSAHGTLTTHGMSKHPAYRAYHQMAWVCRNYAKGPRPRPIPIHEDVATFPLFWAHLGPTWFPGAKLVRVWTQAPIPQTKGDDAGTAMRASNLKWVHE